MLRFTVWHVREDTSKASEETEVADKPDFLPMFPWYSGTSADMYRTIFDLLISVKLFLGRYDNRQMQARTTPQPHLSLDI